MTTDPPSPAGRICALDDLPAQGGREYLLSGESGPLRLILLRHGDRVVAYVNGCKHFVGTPLNPNNIGNFLHPRDPSLIRCGVHGALYHVETGACAHGECDGQGLDPVAVTLRDGAVFLA
ncbi:MAG: Rieske 2Fe-2S domain-containing protein [Magnetococcales bacterium]|nr:Rieske 2Fe-2S domain-containing protein [Magnetococcales bacterium]